MEIPNSNIYEDVPEEELLPKKELLSNIDFLDENLDLTFSFEGAEEILPEITDEDLNNDQERFRILLGELVQLSENKVNIEIKGILEVPDENEEKRRLYSEEKGEISYNIKNIKDYVKELQEVNPKIKNWHFVGDIHTHSLRQSDLSDWQKTRNCSPTDYEFLCRAYNEGRLSPDEPYIFGIGGRDGKETVYSFYRVFIKDGHYRVEEITGV